MLLLCTHVDPKSIGGVATSARRWVAGAEALGEEVIWCQVPVDFSENYCFFSKSGVAQAFSRTEDALAYVRSCHVRAVIVHYATFASNFSLLVKQSLGIPLILNVRGNDVTLDVFNTESYLTKIVPEADFIISVAEHLLLLLEARFGHVNKRSAVVPNGLLDDELSFFTGCTQEHNSTIRFGCIGVWKWKKGLGVCLNAIELIPSAINLFYLFGNLSRAPESSKRTYYRLLELGMQPIQEFQYNERHLIYRGLDVVIVPSLVEGMPNVLIEAMASGCVVVASNIPGIKEVINTYKAGLLFEAGNSIELATILKRITNEPEFIGDLRENAQKGATALSGNPWLKLPEYIRCLIF